MRYLVISPCEDVRSGKEFIRGDEFLPEPDPRQAERLIAARCLEPIPDSAPTLPGTDAADAKIAVLEAARRDLEKANADLRAKGAKIAIDAGATVSAAKREAEVAIGERDEARAQLATAGGRIAELEAIVAVKDAPPATDKPAAKAKGA